MAFPHHHQIRDSRDTRSVNIIEFREPGLVRLDIECPVLAGEEFYVAVGENHGALPDPYEFQAVLKIDPHGGNFRHWTFVRCNASSPLQVCTWR